MLGLPAVVPPDPERLARIYRRPEFVLARWKEAFNTWLNSFLDRLLRVFTGLDGGRVKFYGWLGFGLVLVLAVLAILWLRRRARRSVAVPLPWEQARHLDPAEMEADAHRLAAAGRWGDAVRQLLLAFLGHLDRRGLLPADPTRGNREVLRSLLRRSPGIGPDLRRFLTIADEVTYGGRRPSQPTWHETEASYRQVLAALAAPTAAPTTESESQASAAAKGARR